MRLRRAAPACGSGSGVRRSSAQFTFTLIEQSRRLPFSEQTPPISGPSPGTLCLGRRYGTSLPTALRALYNDGGRGIGGVLRFYRGVLPALVQVSEDATFPAAATAATAATAAAATSTQQSLPQQDLPYLHTPAGPARTLRRHCCQRWDAHAAE